MLASHDEITSQDGDVQRIVGETLAAWWFFAYPSEKYGSQMGS